MKEEAKRVKDWLEGQIKRDARWANLPQEKDPRHGFILPRGEKVWHRISGPTARGVPEAGTVCGLVVEPAVFSFRSDWPDWGGTRCALCLAEEVGVG
jgi:hypothetical protein